MCERERRERERKRERESVCVCEREREKERERVRESERESVCMCVCERKKEHVRTCMCVYMYAGLSHLGAPCLGVFLVFIVELTFHSETQDCTIPTPIINLLYIQYYDGNIILHQRTHTDTYTPVEYMLHRYGHVCRYKLAGLYHRVMYFTTATSFVESEMLAFLAYVHVDVELESTCLSG